MSIVQSILHSICVLNYAKVYVKENIILGILDFLRATIIVL